ILFIFQAHDLLSLFQIPGCLWNWQCELAVTIHLAFSNPLGLIGFTVILLAITIDLRALILWLLRTMHVPDRLRRVLAVVIPGALLVSLLAWEFGRRWMYLPRPF